MLQEARPAVPLPAPGFNQHQSSLAQRDELLTSGAIRPPGAEGRQVELAVGNSQAGDEMALHPHFHIAFNKAQISQIGIMKTYGRGLFLLRPSLG